MTEAIANGEFIETAEFSKNLYGTRYVIHWKVMVFNPIDFIIFVLSQRWYSLDYIDVYCFRTLDALKIEIF